MKISEYLFLFIIVSVVSGLVLYFLPEDCAYAITAVGILLQSVYAYEFEARTNNFTIFLVTIVLAIIGVALIVVSNLYVNYILCRLICYTMAFSATAAFVSSLLGKVFSSETDDNMSIDENEFAALKNENKKLNRMYFEKKDALDSAQNKILSLQREHNSFRQNINDVNERKRANIEKEKQEVLVTANKLKLQLTAAQTLNAELRAQAMQNEQTGHQNDAVIKNLQAKNSVANDKIEELEDDKKTLEVQVKQLKQENNKKIKTLQAEVLAAHDETIKAKKELDKIINIDKKKIEEEKQKFEELKQSFDLMQKMYQEIAMKNEEREK